MKNAINVKKNEQKQKEEENKKYQEQVIKDKVLEFKKDVYKMMFL